MNPYIGHDSQIWSVEEHRLVGGKGDGMRLLEISSGTGVHLTVSLDRAADISRLRFRGINMGYFSPCGYVGPAYYDRREDHFLKSFTAGFLTTCGLESAGVPCEDGGEQVPMHGSIANVPAEYYRWEEEDGEIVVKRPDDEKLHKSLHGLTRTLIANMVEGVTNGYKKELEINGVGYRAAKQGKDLVMNLGYSHQVIVPEVPGITIEVPAPNRVIVHGADKRQVGQFAAEIREKRPPEPYKGKGIKYVDEVIIRKEGKTGKK